MFVVDHNRSWKPYQRTARSVEIKMTLWRELQYKTADQVALNTKLEDNLAATRLQAADAASILEFKEVVNEDEDTAGYTFGKLDTFVSQLILLEGTPEAEGVRKSVLKELRNILRKSRFREDTLLGKRKFAAANRDKEVAVLGLLVRDDKPQQVQDKQQVKVDKVKKTFSDLTVGYDAANAHREKLGKLINVITQDETDAAIELSDNQLALKALTTAVIERRSTYFTWFGPVPLPGKKWLELPILDAFNSPLKIDNHWADDLTIFNNFGYVRRFDRCTTCHQLMDKSLPGQATKAAYENESLIELVLSPPDAEALKILRDLEEELPLLGQQLDTEPDATARAEIKERIAEVEVALAPEARLQTIYGLRFAAEGLVTDADVTVQFVAPESLAARATVAHSESQHAALSGAEIRQQLLAGTFDVGNGPPGINVGDVIHLFDGDSVADATKTLFRLLDTAEAGQLATITVRRGLPQPYTSHPRLDLYIGSLSPHKLADFACTICHDGQGSATDFKWASHTPNTERQRQDWGRDHAWFDNHHWIYPMSPKRFIENTCLKCHHDVTELEASERFPEPPAPKLMKGYHLLRKYGCYGCHEINGYDGEERIGPDMRTEPNVYAAALQLKIDPAYDSLSDEAKDWVEQLIQHPERENVRERLYEILDADKKSADAKLSADTHAHLTPLLRKSESPGKQRKAGPSLRYVKHKVDADFLFDWIREPKHFRPTTRMPQFFGLWNHIQGTSSEAIAARYEPIEVLGITTYLLERSQDFAYAARAQGAAEPDVKRGRTAFQTRGCLACHTHDQFKDAELFRPQDEIIQGPDLSGIGDKLNHEKGRQWLYSWVKDPNRYHSRTVMPNLFLDSHQDSQGNTIDPAADIVAFLGDSSVNWEAKPDTLSGPADLDAAGQVNLNDLLGEHLRDTFSAKAASDYSLKGIPEAYRGELKGAETELLVDDATRNAESFELSAETKLIYIGRKSIAKYGCYGCHDIPGFEDAKPIGTGLADWGRKEPSKLAFEHILNYLGGHGGGHGSEPAQEDSDHEGSGDTAAHSDAGHAGHPTPIVDTASAESRQFFSNQLHAHNRTGFIYQKLLEPRGYDYHKTENKKYNERLRMPQFPFDGDDREAIMTFVLGLVADPPTDKYIYKPDERAAALIAGQQAIEKYNCASCHLLETNTWNVAYRKPFNAQPASPDKPIPVFATHVPAAELAKTAIADPRTGLFHAKLSGMPAIDPTVRSTPAPIAYDDEGEPLEIDYSYDPTTLELGFQLWQVSVLNGMVYEPGIQTALNLPTSWVEQTTAAKGGFLAKYLLPHVFRLEKMANPNANPGEAWAWVPPPLIQEGKKVQTNWLHDFLLNPYRIRPAVFLRMPKFNMSPAEATAIANYFAAKDNVEYPYTFSDRRQADHLERASAKYQQLVGSASGRTRFADAMKIVTNSDGCAKCHLVGDYAPKGSDRAKAPNLAKVYQRLRPDFVKRWIAYPKGILPYTTMPVNIPYDPDSPTLGGIKQDPQRLEVYHGTSVEQLDGLVDLIMNFDAFAKSRSLVTPLVAGAAPADPTTVVTPPVTPAPRSVPTPVPAPKPATTPPATNVIPAVLKDLPKATGWGDLTVRFRFDGTVPMARTFVADKDPEFCGKFVLQDESLIVNPDPENRGIKDVIAYLYFARNESSRMPIHESYFDDARKIISVNNANCRFEPHVVMLWSPQTLEIFNSDDVGHNTNFSTLKNVGLNRSVPAKSSIKVQFPLAEPAVPFACNIHTWMKGVFVVRDDPYFAVSDKDGKLEIKNLPEGEWNIQFYQEKAGRVREGKRGGETIEWERGRVKVTIKNGETTDLGTIDLGPKLFEE
jgi:cytochrome c2